MPNVIVREERRLVDDYFQVYEARFSFERFDGAMSEETRRLFLERGDSVAAIVFNRDTNRLLFTEQFRYPVYKREGGWLVEAVAGVVGKDEPPDVALRREVCEEIGYEIDVLQNLATFYLSPGGSSERVVLYYAEVSNAGRTHPGGGIRAEGEDIRLIELSPEDLRRELALSRIQDAKTLVGALWFLNRNTLNATDVGQNPDG